MRRHTVVDPRFGTRMRALRERRGRSLRDLEHPTLSSKSKLHNIETGLTAPSPETARLIDEALQAGGELVAMVRHGTPGGADEPWAGTPALLASLRTGLATRRWPGAGDAPGTSVASLEADTHLVHDVYQRADYPKAVTLLPVVVAAAEQLAREATGETQRRAHRALASAYLAVSKLAAKLGDGPLAWIAADRAAAAALESEDHLLWAAAAHQTGCALLHMPGRIDDATAVLGGARDDLDRTGDPASAADVSIRGGLCLLGAVVAARRADRAAAERQLAEAEVLAAILREDGNHLWTGFGPTNVRIHRASVAVELHDPERAIELSNRIDAPRLPQPLVSRRAQVHLNLAAAFAQLADGDAPAVLHLLEVERIAPQLLGANHASRALLAQLVGRERRSATPGLRGLARRAGVLG